MLGPMVSKVFPEQKNGNETFIVENYKNTGLPEAPTGSELNNDTNLWFSLLDEVSLRL